MDPLVKAMRSNTVKASIKRAIAAERERCARIAETADRDPRALSLFQGVEIAAAIRNANK